MVDASPVVLLFALLGGAFAWTLAEYVLHRVVFHALPRPILGAGEHRRHHAQPDYFAPAWQKGLAAVGVGAVRRDRGAACTCCAA